MAKKTTKTEAPASDTAVPETIGHGDFTITLSTLSPKALHYLANYGLNKSLQDSVAGLKGEMTKATNEDGTAKHNDAEIAVALNDAQTARLDAILRGTIGSRGPGVPRASKLESIMHTVAVERLRIAAAKKDKKLPKAGSDEFKALVSKVLVAQDAEIRAEAERRMGQGSDVDLGDLI